MTSKPKVVFIYTHSFPELWEDGLHAALVLLESKFEIHKLNLDGVDEDKWGNVPKADCYLGWGGFGSVPDRVLRGIKGKRGLLIGGNLVPPFQIQDYDVLFYETEWYKSQLERHRNLVHAFGVNTEIFRKPKERQEKYWDYVGFGAYANWKRWEMMIEKKGKRLVVGDYQRDNEPESFAIVSKLVKGGVMVSDKVHPRELVKLLWMTKTAYLPAMVIGGGERAVLEARACGLGVEVEGDNPKLQELLKSPVYDHHYYAKQLEKGVRSII